MLRCSNWRALRCAPWPLLFAAAGIGFALVVANGEEEAALAAICRASGTLIDASAWSQVWWAVGGPALGSLLVDWCLMLTAMMPPLLAAPLMHVWRSSGRRKRMLVAADFLIAYGAVWVMTGPVFIAVAALLQVAAPTVALPMVLIVALIWSASPWQRAVLNRSHRLPRISLFGVAAHQDGLKFGATHGLLCVATCWAWMLLPLLGGRYHVPLMLLAGLIIFAERLTTPRQPKWRLPGLALRDRGRGPLASVVVRLRQ